MPNAAWVAIAVTIALFAFTHIGITIAWASRVNTTLKFVLKEMEKIAEKLSNIEAGYVSQKEYLIDRTNTIRELKALWTKIDEIAKSGGA